MNKNKLISLYLRHNGIKRDLTQQEMYSLTKTIGFKLFAIKEEMRRFKKKMLGWLTPKTIEKIFVQKRDVAMELTKIKGKVVEVRDLSKNVTMIRYEKV